MNFFHGWTGMKFSLSIIRLIAVMNYSNLLSSMPLAFVLLRSVNLLSSIAPHEMDLVNVSTSLTLSIFGNLAARRRNLGGATKLVHPCEERLRIKGTLIRIYGN